MKTRRGFARVGLTLSLLTAGVGAVVEVPARQATGTSYDVTIPQGLSTIANHLDRGGNTVAVVLPNVPEGTLLYKYDRSRFTFKVNHFQSGAWSRPTETLAPGEGALIRSPGIEFAVTFTGTTPTNTQLPELYRHLDLVSFPVPGETLLPIPNSGDQVFLFSPAAQSYQGSTFDGIQNEWLPPLNDLLMGIGASFFYSSFNLPAAPADPEPGGTVYFCTLLPDAGLPGIPSLRERREPVDARVTSPDGTPLGAGFTAQLYGGPAGTPIDQLVPLTPTTTFQTASAELKGYVKPVLLTPPGIAPGSSATFVMRVFDGASFETSAVRGQSKPITVSLIGPNTVPPANLVGLQGFTVPAPAEQSYSLAIPPGISTIANHLDRGGNTLAEVLPSVPEGTVLYKYDRSQGSYTVNHYQSGTWSRPTETLAPGDGAYIRNPGTEFSIAFTGTKPSLQLAQPYRFDNFISLPVPGESALATPYDGESIFRFDASLQKLSAGSFDALANKWFTGIMVEELLTKVGESFFYRSSSSSRPLPPVEPNASGTVYFSTQLPDAGLPEIASFRDYRRAVDARITWADGAGVSEGFTAQLYGGPAGTPIDQLVPLTPTTTFQTTSAAVKGYVKPILVTLPEVKGNNAATIVMRVFDGASYESSNIRGESAPITISLGSGVLPPASLVGLQRFTLAGPADGTSYSLTIPPGLSTIANHLNHGGNTAMEVLPSVPEGTLLYKFDEAGNVRIVNHFQSGAWSHPQETLAPGEGAYIRNGGSEFSITFTGTKPSIQLPQIYRGNNFMSLPVPGQTSLPTPHDGDALYRFDSSRQTFRVATFDALAGEWLPPGILQDLATRIGESFIYRCNSLSCPLPPVELSRDGTVYFST